MPIRWSVGVEAQADRVLTRAEVVELADAVAVHGGIATGIGSTRYGAQVVVLADTREEAAEAGTATFRAAAARAGLPAGPVVRVEVIGEDEDEDADGAGPAGGPAVDAP